MNLPLAISLIILLVLVIVAITRAIIESNNYLAKEKKTYEDRREERRKKEENEYALNKAYLIEKFGTPTIEINLGFGKHYIQSYFYVFEETKIIVYDLKEYNFCDILGYSLVDESTSETISTSVGESKISTGSMVTRATVGGVLTGGIGAVAGAVTAKKNTTVDGISTTTTIHKYIVYLYINSLSNPSLKIPIGSNRDNAHKISGILNVILERNKS